MNIIILIAIIAGLSMQDVFRKIYNLKTNSGGAYLFSALSAMSAMMFFVATGSDMTWTTAFIPYSIVFGIFYAVAVAGSVIAVAVGPLSLTALVISLSLMIPTFYGIMFLNEPIDICSVLGFVLLVTSLVMVNLQKGEKNINAKWVLFAGLSFVGNGVCTVVQTIEQRAFNGAYKSEFMIVSLALVTVLLGILFFTHESKKKPCKIGLNWVFCILNGITNGMVNLFVMILSRRMLVSLMFPLMSAGSLILTYIIAMVFYKERLSRIQTIGFAFGLVAVVFLNI